MKKQIGALLLALSSVTIAFATLTPGGGGGGGGSPSGPAGGDLANTYPNPTLAQDRVRLAGDTMTGGLSTTLLKVTTTTPSRVVITDTLNDVASSAVSSTEVAHLSGLTSDLAPLNGITGSVLAAYLNGLTSNAQTQLNTKQSTLSTGNLTGSGSLTVSSGTNAVIGAGVQLSVSTATSSSNGVLTANDWTTFNSKEPSQTKGTISGTSPVSVSGGTNATVGPAVTVSVATASATTTGLLTAADWTTFNTSALGSYVAKAGDSMSGPLNVGAAVNAQNHNSTLSSGNYQIAGSIVLSIGTGAAAQNTAVGIGALSSLSSATSSVAVGFNALNALTTGVDNTAVGNQAGLSITTGLANVFLGSLAGQNCTTCVGNHALGRATLLNITTGMNNIAVGRRAGLTITTQANNILIGATADVGSSTVSNGVAIGYLATINASSAVQMGSGTNSTANSLQFNAYNFLLDTGAATFSAINDTGLAASQITQTDASKNLISSNALPSGTTGPFVLKAGDTMTGPLAHAQGTVSAPGVSFGVANSGFYMPALGDVGITTGGAKRFNVTSSGSVSVPGLTASQLVQTDGSSNLTTSMTIPSGLTLGSVTVAGLLTMSGGTLLVQPGSTTGPIISLGLAGQPSTGLVLSSGLVAIFTSGTNQMQVTGSGVQFGNGSAAAPILNFFNSSTTGVFRPLTSQMGISTGAAEALRISTASNTPTFPTLSINGTTQSGFYAANPGDISIGTGKALRFNVTSSGSINIPGLTASQLVQTDGSQNLVSSDTLPGDTALNTSATIITTNTTDSSSTSTGAIQDSGGAAVKKTLYVGADAYFGNDAGVTSPARMHIERTGYTTGSNNINITNSSGGDALNLGITGTTTPFVQFSTVNWLNTLTNQPYIYAPSPGLIIGTGTNAKDYLNFSTTGLKVGSTTDATSATTGSLQALGGVGITKSLAIGTNELHTGYQYAVMGGATNVVMSATATDLLLDPSGTITGMTVTLPASPSDGQLANIGCNDNAIVSLTVVAGTNTVKAPAAGACNVTTGGGFGFLYQSSSTTWFRQH